MVKVLGDLRETRVPLLDPNGQVLPTQDRTLRKTRSILLQASDGFSNTLFFCDKNRDVINSKVYIFTKSLIICVLEGLVCDKMLYLNFDSLLIRSSIKVLVTKKSS